MTTMTPGLRDGKAVLIIGASQGIGGAAARRFAEEGADRDCRGPGQEDRGLACARRTPYRAGLWA